MRSEQEIKELGFYLAVINQEAENIGDAEALQSTAEALLVLSWVLGKKGVYDKLIKLCRKEVTAAETVQ